MNSSWVDKQLYDRVTKLKEIYLLVFINELSLLSLNFFPYKFHDEGFAYILVIYVAQF